MILSKKRYDKIFHIFLILIALTVFFRKLCTIIIILFVLFSILNYKRLYFKKKDLLFLIIISSPLSLQLLFFWNNNSLFAGLKSLEKLSTLLFFPILIIGNLERVNFLKILKWYTRGSILILILLLFRFIFTSPKFFNTYLEGKDLWEVGYEFTRSFGMHAPALNMHLAFITTSLFYFILNCLNKKNKVISKRLIFNIILLIFGFFLILFVNTRLALVELFLGMIIVFFMTFERSLFKTKNAVILFLSFSLLFFVFLGYVKNNPYMREKYTTVTFAHLDKIGKLDEVENPVSTIYNSFVTRLSIWKTSLELASHNIFFGVGASDSNEELFNYYQKTNQKFLAESKFPPHNQFLDYSIKFGFLGFFVVSLYIFFIGYLGVKSKSPLILSFFIIFLLSNLVDDFLVRFDGIVFSAFWVCVFTSDILRKDLG